MSDAPSTPDSDPALDLPELREGRLDDDELTRLFRDIAQLGRQVEIRVRGGPRTMQAGPDVTLDEALARLRARSVRGVQIRYRYDGADWCDTLLAEQGFVRLVRVKSQMP